MSDMHITFKDEQIQTLRHWFAERAKELLKLPRVSNDALTFVPMQSVSNRWIKWFEHKSITGLGMAALISDQTDELPPIAVAVKSDAVQVYSYGCSYSYSVEELNQFLMENINLSTEEAELAREKCDDKVDEVILHGANGNPGFFTNGNVPSVVVPANSGNTSTKFADKTYEECVKTIRTMLDQYKANNKARNGKLTIPGKLTIILPTAAKNALVDKVNQYSNESWFESLKKHFADDIGEWFNSAELEGLGTGKTDRAILYRRDVKYLASIVPMTFYSEEPERKGFKWRVPCMCRTAGTVIKYIKSVLYADGV